MRRCAFVSAVLASCVFRSSLHAQQQLQPLGPVASQARCFSECNVLQMRKFRGRKTQARKREAQEGDWLCACGETNYRSKRECFKCGAPAPPLPPGVRRPSRPGEDPHDWACPCGKMNFRGSVVCFICKQPKPSAPPPPGQEVSMWKCPKCSNINRNVKKHCFKCFTPSPLGAPAGLDGQM